MINENLIKAAGFIYLAVAFIFWFGAMFFMFRVVKFRKPGVNMWRDTLLNPFNLIFMSPKLTEKGLKARKNLIICSVVFIFLCLLPILIKNVLK